MYKLLIAVMIPFTAFAEGFYDIEPLDIPHQESHREPAYQEYYQEPVREYTEGGLTLIQGGTPSSINWMFGNENAKPYTVTRIPIESHQFEEMIVGCFLWTDGQEYFISSKTILTEHAGERVTRPVATANSRKMPMQASVYGSFDNSDGWGPVRYEGSAVLDGSRIKCGGGWAYAGKSSFMESVTHLQ